MTTAQQLGTGTDGRTDGNSVRRSAMLLAFRTSNLQGKTTEREVPSFRASTALTVPVGPLHHKDFFTANITQYQGFMKDPKDTQSLHEIVDV